MADAENRLRLETADGLVADAEKRLRSETADFKIFLEGMITDKKCTASVGTRAAHVIAMSTALGLAANADMLCRYFECCADTALTALIDSVTSLRHELIRVHRETCAMSVFWRFRCVHASALGLILEIEKIKNSRSATPRGSNALPSDELVALYTKVSTLFPTPALDAMIRDLKDNPGDGSRAPMARVVCNEVDNASEHVAQTTDAKLARLLVRVALESMK